MKSCMPKILTMLFSLSTVFILFLTTPAFALENKQIMLAVNTDFSSASSVEAFFTPMDILEPVLESDSTGDNLTVPVQNCVNIRTDPDSGKVIYEVEPDLPELPEPVYVKKSASNSHQLHLSGLSSYSTGDTKKIALSFDEDDPGHNLKCLYIGTYCTVWGSMQDNSAIRMNTTQATQIGNEFDRIFPLTTNAFGSYWTDVDGDGKIAIFCYDIDSDYPNWPDVCSLGFFWPVELVNEEGYVNDCNFGKESYLNGIDCIHMDTYPTMVKGTSSTSLDDVSYSYSTLVHEFQHLLNFSRSVEGDYYGTMDTYLNEAFSMAAQHMIYGSDETSSRIETFNGTDYYTAGSPLTLWEGTLSNYSNSYLFGQYVRTQYGEKTGTDGNTIFKEIQNQRSATNTDSLSIVCDLLDISSKKRLIQNFWVAVALKNNSGPYGFNGETWANAIDISNHLQSSFSTTNQIYNGGVRYYSSVSSSQVVSKTNLAFVDIGKNGTVTFPESTVDLTLSESNIELLVGESKAITISLSGELPDSYSIVVDAGTCFSKSLSYSFGATVTRTLNITGTSPGEETVSVKLVDSDSNETVASASLSICVDAAGDTNRDGERDIFDALLVLKYDAGLLTLSDREIVISDVNKSGEVDVFDALLLLKYDAGLISTFD